jgi:uncharacterized damage-inducible protein DinB
VDMLQEFQRLFAYDAWANQEVVTSLTALGSAPSRPLQLLAHILSAERLWLERLQQKKQTYPVWPDFTLAQCQAELNDLPGLMTSYLTSLPPDHLAATIHYKNSKGESWSNSIHDILMHVVMHSAYHRGQIATAMRAAGHTPAYTDFIHGVRQGLVE